VSPFSILEREKHQQKIGRNKAKTTEKELNRAMSEGKSSEYYWIYPSIWSELTKEL
jgi:hypothetical protein